ncbi:MAG: hypothetical protein AAB466_06220 [Verrucomicrobiota bacterium]
MKTKKCAIRFFIGCLLATMLVGCASMSIRERNKQLSKLDLGMNKDQVLAIMPGGVPRGAKLYPNGSVSVLEYEAGTYAPFNDSANPWTGMVNQTMWLYFYNGKLVQWGKPGDWPANPDAIIEIRNR